MKAITAKDRAMMERAKRIAAEKWSPMTTNGSRYAAMMAPVMERIRKERENSHIALPLLNT